MITTIFAEISPFDDGMSADRKRVRGQLDAPFHLTAEGEVLGSTQLALDDHRLADIQGELRSQPAIGAGSLRGAVARSLLGLVA
jgi:hypothetical protein